MKNKSQKYIEDTISKRFFLLSILKGAIVAGIGWRFFDLQMIENRKYEKLSDNNQFNFHMIAPERGRILDRKMRLLAGNMDGFSLVDLSPIFFHVGITLILYPIINISINFFNYVSRLIKS